MHNYLYKLHFKMPLTNRRFMPDYIWHIRTSLLHPRLAGMEDLF